MNTLAITAGIVGMIIGAVMVGLALYAMRDVRSVTITKARKRLDIIV